MVKVVLLINLCFRQNVIPQPFHAIPSAQEVEYLSDVLIYDIDNLSWHGVKAKGAPVASKVDIAEANERLRTPDGRYGMQLPASYPRLIQSIRIIF